MIDLLFAIGHGLFTLGMKALFGFGLIYFALGWVNDKHGINVKEDIVNVIRKDPRATAIYYGDRLKTAGMVILGICIGSL